MISILIPLYNGVEFINEAVLSILNQTYSQWELLIGVNGHLPESSVYLTAKAFEKISDKIRVFDFYQLKGKSNTLNHMLEFCNYNYIALLDVDDIWLPKKLEIQSKLLGIYDVIGTKCVWFGEKSGSVPNIPVGDISKYNFGNGNPIINSSCIIRKELCYWNENGIEDYDLWLRLKKAGKKFFNCKTILVKHRIHSDSAFNAQGNGKKVNALLLTHGYTPRSERNRNPTKIIIPKINKMNMVL
jgi:glycosyltransferase involved in cell wall biosynthesis